VTSVTSSVGRAEEVQIATLLVRVGGAQASAFASLLAPLGLRPKQFGLMNVVALADGPSQGEIGAAMGIDPSGLIATIDDLEERGWLERRRDPPTAGATSSSSPRRAPRSSPKGVRPPAAVPRS
jgi:hypothetical protein